MNQSLPPSPMYPRLLRRVRAVLIDEVVLLAGLAAWWLTLGLADVNVGLKIASLLLVFLALDPALVAFTGGTIGHHLMGLKVRDAARDARVSLPRATVRALVRYLLGGLSLIFVLVTRRHQAMHDYASRTLVVLRAPDRFSGRERLAERADVAGG